jgi:hypothetical protein
MATELPGSHRWAERWSDCRVTCMYVGWGGFGGATPFTLEL